VVHSQNEVMQDRSVQIVVNGLKESVPGDSTIASLIALFGEEDGHLIVEHNGQFVYPQKYGEIHVRDGDRIEFINPNFGG
jgi:thiamine biosynthesis protein ThiS